VIGLPVVCIALVAGGILAILLTDVVAWIWLSVAGIVVWTGGLLSA
jgi:hypothetical protein